MNDGLALWFDFAVTEWLIALAILVILVAVGDGNARHGYDQESSARISGDQSHSPYRKAAATRQIIVSMLLPL